MLPALRLGCDRYGLNQHGMCYPKPSSKLQTMNPLIRKKYWYSANLPKYEGRTHVAGWVEYVIVSLGE